MATTVIHNSDRGELVSSTTTANQAAEDEISVPEEWALVGRVEAEAKLLAKDLLRQRSSRYHSERLRSSKSMRTRVPERTQELVKQLSDSSDIESGDIREMIATAIEEELGENSRVVCGWRWIKVKKF